MWKGFLTSCHGCVTAAAGHGPRPQPNTQQQTPRSDTPPLQAADIALALIEVVQQCGMLGLHPTDHSTDGGGAAPAAHTGTPAQSGGGWDAISGSTVEPHAAAAAPPKSTGTSTGLEKVEKTVEGQVALLKKCDLPHIISMLPEGVGKQIAEVIMQVIAQ